MGLLYHLLKASLQGLGVCLKHLSNLTALFCWLLCAPWAHLVVAEGQICIAHCILGKDYENLYCGNTTSAPFSPFVFPFRSFLLWHGSLLNAYTFMVKLEQFMRDFIDPLQSLPPLLKIAMSLGAIGMLYFEWFCFRNVPETFVSSKKVI